MPIWLIKHWRPLAAAAVVSILIGLWHTDRAHQYRSGAEDTAASIKAKLAETAAKQAAAARNTERKQADALAAAQVKIEKERQDAQTVITDMRRELDRLRRHAETTARRMPAAGQPAGYYSARAQSDMQTWQKPPTPSATTLPNGRPTAQ